MSRRAGALREKFGGVAHVFADGEGRAGAAHGANLVERRAAVGRGAPFAGRDAVERLRDVGQEDRLQIELADCVAQSLDVGDREVDAGQDIDEPQGGRGLGRHERVDQSHRRPGPTFFERAVEIRRRGENDLGAGHLLGALRKDEAEIALEILAARLGQRRRADADQFWIHALLEIEQRFLDMVCATQNGGDLVHRCRLQRDRFLEVTHE